jgi:choline dehydrogenase-like flavoprotein
LRSAPDLTQADIQLHFVVAKLVNHGRTPSWGHGYSLHVCLLQPQSRGKVRLASTDANVPPLIDPKFLTHANDMVHMLAGVRHARRIMASPALSAHGCEVASSAGAQTDAQPTQWIRRNADTIYHPVGTCRMGQDAMAVVDAQLRVRGVQGLRVVDASVMPRIVSGNTNAPTIMLAEKAADLIRTQASDR